MIVLDKWYICYDGAGYVACGIVYGHMSPLCPDGSDIHTSLIEEVEFSREEGAFVLHTLNSEYLVKISDMDCECYDPLRSMCVFGKFAEEHDIEDSMELVARRYGEVAAEVAGFKRELTEKLPDRSLFIEFTDSLDFYFEAGMYRGENGASEFFGRLTDFDYDFTTLVASVNYLVEFVPYKHGNIQFLSHSSYMLPGEFLGIIRNSGMNALNIRFSWGGLVIVAPGTELEVYEGMGAPLPLTCREQDQ